MRARRWSAWRRRGTSVALCLGALPTFVGAQQTGVTVYPWDPPPGCGGSPTQTHVGPSHFVSVPDLRGKTLDEAKAIVEQSHLTLDARGDAIGAPNSIVTQAPRAGEPASPGDVVIGCWRLPQVTMPRLTRLSGAAAAARIDTAVAMGGLKLAITRRWLSSTVSDDARAVVDSQNPLPDDTLNPQSRIELFLRDTSAPRVLMPNLYGLTQKVATDTLARLFGAARLTLQLDTLLAAGSAKPTASARVVDQNPQAGSVLSAQSQVRMFLREPDGPGIAPIILRFLAAQWKWIAAVLPLLVIVAALLWRSRRLAALTLVPHLDMAPSVNVETLALAGADSVATPALVDAEQEFARLGLTLDAVADPGTQQLYLT